MKPITTLDNNKLDKTNRHQRRKRGERRRTTQLEHCWGQAEEWSSSRTLGSMKRVAEVEEEHFEKMHDEFQQLEKVCLKMKLDLFDSAKIHLFRPKIAKLSERNENLSKKR